jgi:hypothetical protein
MAGIRPPGAFGFIVFVSVAATSCAALPRPSSVPHESPAAIRPSPSPVPTDAPSSAPMPLPSLCATPTLAPPAAVLDTEPGLLSSYSWSSDTEGVDATGVVPGAAQFTRPIQATAQERLIVEPIGDCAVTEWSVRAIDPAAGSGHGSVGGPVQELAREPEAVGGGVVFRAPDSDAVIEVFLRFGSQGSGAYYWLLKIGEFR